MHDTVSQHERLIQNLFQGEKSDYVCCLECGNVTNTDAVLFGISNSLSLPTGQGDGPARTSTDGPDAVMDVREALRQILTPEQLRDREQYHCAHCKCWTSAERGMLGMHLRTSLTPCTADPHSVTHRMSELHQHLLSSPAFYPSPLHKSPPPLPPHHGHMHARCASQHFTGVKGAR